MNSYNLLRHLEERIRRRMIEFVIILYYDNVQGNLNLETKILRNVSEQQTVKMKQKHLFSKSYAPNSTKVQDVSVTGAH